ncbi:MAG: 2-phospho-L-lactate guanylyltransferase [Nitrososphaerales archaeon]
MIIEKSCAIIPVREFANTKLRLRGFLNENERSQLTSTLLGGVLLAIERSRIDRALVVASNPDEVEDDFHSVSKVRVLKESQTRGGVNSAMQDGMRFLSQENLNVSKMLLMPSDLPFLDSCSLNRALELKESYDLIINGSRKKDGTSLLLLEPSKMIPLHYDNNSFVNHQKEASKLGFHYLLTDYKPFSFDVDDDIDLAVLMQELRATSFKEALTTLLSLRDRK